MERPNELLTMVTTLSGRELAANLEFRRRLTWSGSFTPEEYGPWLHGLLSVLGDANKCRLRFEDDLIVAIGHPTEDRWFDHRPAWMTAKRRAAQGMYSSALAHINCHRARSIQRPLDPEAAGWSRDDVFREAERLGWTDD